MKNIFSRRTPLNEDYGSCSFTKSDLYIFPGDLSPHLVTSELGLQPTDVNVRGMEITTKLGGKRIVRNNGWFLSSEGMVHSLDVRHHIDWLLRLLSDKKDELLALQLVPGLKMSVNCIWYSRSGMGGPTLWPEQMLALAELNLECSFDVYFFDNDES